MPASPAPRLRVGFILTPRFTLCAFANFVDVLRLAADEGDRSRPILCRWRVLSATMDPVSSSSGIVVQPEERLGDPTRFDYIVVIGGLMQELETLAPAYVSFLQRAAAAGVPLVGVCTGAFVLHRAGLMQGYRACVSWFHHNDFLEQFTGITPVSDQIFVVDRDRLTCSGGTSSAQLAAFLVDRHIGRAASKKSLAIMMIDETMAVGSAQDTHEAQRYGYLLTGALLYTTWNLATAAGAMLSQAGDLVERWGIDATIPAAFLALVWPRLTRPEQRWVVVGGAVIATVLVPIAPAGIPIIAAAVAVFLAR